MIEIKDAKRRYGNDLCNSCLSDDHTQRIYISLDGSQSSSFVLCSKCRDELARRLVMTDTYEETDQKGGTENEQVQEAIDVLRNIGNEIDDFCNGAKHWSDKDKKELKALNMAIEALQFKDIMINNPKTAKPTPEVCKNCKDNDRPHEPTSDDLIIKGAKGIQDGLYIIQNGKLFQYKAKGGTVRTYPIAEVPQDN